MAENHPDKQAKRLRRRAAAVEIIGAFIMFVLLLAAEVLAAAVIEYFTAQFRAVNPLHDPYDIVRTALVLWGLALVVRFLYAFIAAKLKAKAKALQNPE